MVEKVVRVPDASHPMIVEPTPERVVVSRDGRVIADTVNALSLREAGYPVVQYIPRVDADMAALERTERQTYCPYKGACSYFSLAAAGEQGRNAVWTYEAPYDAVAAIKDHLAFFPDRVTIELDPR